MMTISSMMDWFFTRYYRIKEEVNETLFHYGLTDRVPPSALNFTTLLDRADRQNTLRDTLK